VPPSVGRPDAGRGSALPTTGSPARSRRRPEPVSPPAGVVPPPLASEPERPPRSAGVAAGPGAGAGAGAGAGDEGRATAVVPVSPPGRSARFWADADAPVSHNGSATINATPRRTCVNVIPITRMSSPAARPMPNAAHDYCAKCCVPCVQFERKCPRLVSARPVFLTRVTNLCLVTGMRGRACGAARPDPRGNRGKIDRRCSTAQRSLRSVTATARSWLVTAR
jgi:hypothetical protein